MSALPRRTRRLTTAALALAALAGLDSCAVHEHTIGTGPSGLGTTSVRQFYLFFGWLPLNDADTQRLAESATSYRIRTEWSFLDVILTPFLLPLTVTTRTVTVER